MQAPQPAREKETDTVRNMETSKFMKTDINKYLEMDDHVNCISCVNCIRKKNKVLQFKYNPSLKSDYTAHFTKSDSKAKQAIWNLDSEKRKLKVDYQPPGTFTTTYHTNY
jgi:hypothetical protein